MNNEEARESQRAWEPARQAMARSRRQLAATKRAAGANPKARKSAGKEWARRLRESQEGNQKKKKEEERRKEKIDAGRGARERRRVKKSRRPAMRAGDGDLVPKSRLELPTY